MVVITAGDGDFCVLLTFGLGRESIEGGVADVRGLFITLERWVRLVVTDEGGLDVLELTLLDRADGGLLVFRDAFRQRTEARREAALIICFSSLAVSFVGGVVTRKPVLVWGLLEIVVERSRSSTGTPISGIRQV